MRLTVLGCQSPYPGPGGATPGYLVQTDSVNILIDCGSGVMSQLTKVMPPYKLDAVLISHYHQDHIADVGVLQYGIMVHQAHGQRPSAAPLPLYAPAQPQEWASRMSYRQATEHHVIDEQTKLTIGDIAISFLRTDHDIPCYAMKLTASGKSIVYGADSGPQTDWHPFAEAADLFICEGTFITRTMPTQLSGHLSVRKAAQIAQSLNCKALVITHLFHEYTNEEVLADAREYTNGNCYLAEVGLQLDI